MPTTIKLHADEIRPPVLASGNEVMRTKAVPVPPSMPFARSVAIGIHEFKRGQI